MEAGLRQPWSLFVNVEPGSLHLDPPPGALAIVDAGRDRLDVVIEFTERALTARPAALLATAAAAREAGWRLALDDVGADRDSLVLLPLLRPDVIKLDLNLVQRRPSPLIAATVHAVNAEAERTGAAIVAEGIENETHLNVALAMGATHGQGWYFARLGALDTDLAWEAPNNPLGRRKHRTSTATPFALAERRRSTRRAPKRLRAAMTQHLEWQAYAAGENTVVLAAFQLADFFTPAIHRRYADLGRHSAFVGALGVGMPSQPAPRVRGGNLDADHPLHGEWDITVIGPHFAGALIARDIGDDGPR